MNEILRQTTSDNKQQLENYNASTFQAFINIIIGPTKKNMEYCHLIKDEQTKETCHKAPTN